MIYFEIFYACRLYKSPFFNHSCTGPLTGWLTLPSRCHVIAILKNATHLLVHLTLKHFHFVKVENCASGDYSATFKSGLINQAEVGGRPVQELFPFIQVVLAKNVLTLFGPLHSLSLWLGTWMFVAHLTKDDYILQFPIHIGRMVERQEIRFSHST